MCSAASNSVKKYQDLLDALDKAKPAEAWVELTAELSKPESEGELKPLDPPTKAEWTTSVNKDKDTSARSVGMLRVLAMADGQTTWDELLKALIQDENKPADLRAWALYACTQAGVQVRGEDANILKNLVEEEKASKVRQWAAYALGQVSSKAERAKWPPSSRFADEEDATRKDAMLALIKRWDKEIDLFVRRELVISLGSAGHLILDNRNRRSLEEVLEQAARDRHSVLWSVVPLAVEDILAARRKDYPDESPDVLLLGWLGTAFFSDNGAHQWDLGGSSEAKERTRSELRDAFGVLVRIADSMGSAAYPHSLNTVAAAAGWILGREDAGYEVQRAAIVSLSRLTPLVCQESTKSGVGEAVEHALDVLVNRALGAKAADPQGGASQEGPAVRLRSVQAIRDLGRGARKGGNACPDASKLLIGTLTKTAKAPLAELLGAPQEGMPDMAANALIFIIGEEEAGTVLVNDYILSDNRTSAARLAVAHALGRLPAESCTAAIELLAETAKNDQSVRSQRALTALESIGRSEATEAALETREWVYKNYFKPMEKADKAKEKLIRDVRWKGWASFGFTVFASLFVVFFGSWLMFSSLEAVKGDLANWKDLAPGIVGMVAALGGILVPFFWNPAKAVQSSNADITKIVTAFDGYAMRMRLLGLGFAHAYSRDATTSKELNFLTTMSNAAGVAVAESAAVISQASSWPGASSVEVPDLRKKTWKEAVDAVGPLGLQLGLQKQDFSDIDEGKIVEHKPPAKSMLTAGSSIDVVVSKGKEPEMVKVPDLLGKTWEEAIGIVKPLGLGVALESTKSDAAQPLGKICEQRPSAESLQAGGTMVQVALSLGEKPAG